MSWALPPPTRLLSQFWRADGQSQGGGLPAASPPSPGGQHSPARAPPPTSASAPTLPSPCLSSPVSRTRVTGLRGHPVSPERSHLGSLNGIIYLQRSFFQIKAHLQFKGRVSFWRAATQPMTGGHLTAPSPSLCVLGARDRGALLTETPEAVRGCLWTLGGCSPRCSSRTSSDSARHRDLSLAADTCRTGACVSVRSPVAARSPGCESPALGQGAWSLVSTPSSTPVLGKVPERIPAFPWCCSAQQPPRPRSHQPSRETSAIFIHVCGR